MAAALAMVASSSTLAAQAAPAGTPVGNLDVVTAVDGGVLLKGWAWDPDSTVAASLTVNGGRTEIQTTTGTSRPDVARAFPAAGRYTGFEVTVPSAGGPVTVCVTVKNVGPGADKTFACKSVDTPSLMPIGNIEVVTATDDGVRVEGWAADQDTSEPITVRIAVDGAISELTTSRARPDVVRAFPGVSATAGFITTIQTPPGTHSVCVTAADFSGGNDKVFACRTTTVTDHSPSGVLSPVTETDGGLRVNGWASDIDATNPLAVRLATTDQATRASLPAVTVAANLARSGSATPDAFDTVLPLKPGSYQVCATAVNVGLGADNDLGCASQTVRDHDPSGATETVTDSALGGLDVSGWAADIDDAAVRVRLDVTGAALLSRTVSATSAHGIEGSVGFAASLPLAPGAYQVCVTALNAGPGKDKSIGCLAGTVLDHSPSGMIERADAGDLSLTVSGWASDQDAFGPVAVRITVGGTTVETNAVAPSGSMGAAAGTEPTGAAFTTTIQVAPGTYSVCAVAVNTGLGTDTAFPCVTATVQAPPIVVPTEPGAANTGVPAGTRLTVHNGDLTITTPGAVVDGLDVRGYLRIKAPNVTVKNSIIRGRSGLTGSMALVQNSSTGVQLIDTELVAAYPTWGVDGFVGSNATFTRVNIHGVIDSIKLTGGNVVIQDSWLHDNLYYATTPSGHDTHSDNLQIQAGSNITVRNSVLTGAWNSAVMITQDTGAVSAFTFTGNRADNGSCTVNIAEKRWGPVAGVTITGNSFGVTQRSSRCAIIAPLTTSSISTISTNSFTDGSAFKVNRG